MDDAEAVTYLRKESGRADLTETNAECIAGELGRLRLALSHAAAYLRDVDNATPESFLAVLSQRLKDTPDSADYTRAAFTTLMESIRQAEARAPGAAAVLSLASFFASDYIPEELYGQSVAHYPLALLQPVVGNPVAIGEGHRRARASVSHRVSEVKIVASPFIPSCRRQRGMRSAPSRRPGPALPLWLSALPFRTSLRKIGAPASAWLRTRALPPGAQATRSASHWHCCSTKSASTTNAPPMSKPSSFANARSRSREKALGPDHPEVSTWLNNLAALYSAQGKYDLAEPLYQRAVAILKKTLTGPPPSRPRA